VSGIVLAWLAGEAIVSWRWAKGGAPPPPGSLAAASGFFALCALLGQYPPARTVATLLAVGIDIAAILQVLPGSKAQAKTGWPPALITDPTQLFPGTAGTSTAGNPSNPQSGPGAQGPGGTPGTPVNPGTPPTGSGTVYPPGSQNLLWPVSSRASDRCRPA